MSRGMMKRSITVVFKDTRTRVVWYDGTSDAMVEKAMCMLLGLPSSASYLLKDSDGDLVPIAASLPPNEYVVVQFGDAGDGHMLTANAEDARSLVGTSSSKYALSTSTPGTLEVVNPSPVPRTKRTAVPMASKSLKKTAPTALMKLFLEAFTVPLAPDDVINFIPNHGEFGIDKLYAALVPATYQPHDTTTFYKLASSSIVLDRQRVIRYYRVGDAYTQLAAVGKGPLLRAYVQPSLLALPPHSALLAKFAMVLDESGATDWVARRYTDFLHGFSPISRTAFLADTA